MSVLSCPLAPSQDTWGRDIGEVHLGELASDSTQKIGFGIHMSGGKAHKVVLFPKEMEAAVVQGTHDPAVIILLNFALDIPEARRLHHDEFHDALVGLRTALQDRAQGRTTEVQEALLADIYAGLPAFREASPRVSTRGASRAASNGRSDSPDPLDGHGADLSKMTTAQLHSMGLQRSPTPGQPGQDPRPFSDHQTVKDHEAKTKVYGPLAGIRKDVLQGAEPFSAMIPTFTARAPEHARRLSGKVVEPLLQAELSTIHLLCELHLASDDGNMDAVRRMVLEELQYIWYALGRPDPCAALATARSLRVASTHCGGQFPAMSVSSNK